MEFPTDDWLFDEFSGRYTAHRARVARVIRRVDPLSLRNAPYTDVERRKLEQAAGELDAIAQDVAVSLRWHVEDLTWLGKNFAAAISTTARVYRERSWRKRTTHPHPDYGFMVRSMATVDSEHLILKLAWRQRQTVA